jgi:hypothetical protein
VRLEKTVHRLDLSCQDDEVLQRHRGNSRDEVTEDVGRWSQEMSSGMVRLKWLSSLSSLWNLESGEISDSGVQEHIRMSDDCVVG